MSLFAPTPDQRTAVAAPLAERMRPAHARGVRRPGASPRSRQAAPRPDRSRRRLFDDLLGPARHRQNHPRQNHRRNHPRHLHRVLRRHSGIKEIKQVMVHAEKAAAWALRTILFIDEIHRFNKRPAGCLPALRRARLHPPHRRHHRESLLRTQRRAALPLPRLHAAAAHRSADRHAPPARPRRLRPRPRRPAHHRRRRALEPSPPTPAATPATPSTRSKSQPNSRPARKPAHHPRDRRRSPAAARPALRQAGRAALRHHLRAAQIRPQLRRRRRPLLARPHARSRRRSDVRRPPRRPHGRRRHRPRRARGSQPLPLRARHAFDFLGSPEGELALAQAVVYLALAPKSNAVYTAYGAVTADIEATAPSPSRSTCATRRPS